MKNGIYSGFKSVVLEIGGVMNGLIDIFNNGASSIVTTMNDLINSYNKIASQFSAQAISNISFISIPKLTIPKFATGGIVDRPTLGIFGKSGKEAIVPLEKNTGWIDQAAERISFERDSASDELLKGFREAESRYMGFQF